jgi:hypothetical protein
MRNKDYKEYFVWKNMRARCKGDKHYVKKGIVICERWNKFSNFLLDMGLRPSDKHSIDRIDNDKNYEPSNCRWTTQKVQCSNRGSFNKVFTYNGKAMVLKDWAKELGIKYTTLHQRIFKNHLSFEEAIVFEANVYIYDGRKYTLKELSDTYNIPKANISDRLHKGWNLEKILNTPVRKR